MQLEGAAISGLVKLETLTDAIYKQNAKLLKDTFKATAEKFQFSSFGTNRVKLISAATLKRPLTTAGYYF